MSHVEQFTLYTHLTGPNGWKVVMVLEELGLKYKSIYLDFSKNEQKGPEHTRHNPNGRIPTLIDHQNGDFAIWESNAIILYLVARYDTQKRLTYTDDKHHSVVQWLFFQASGQGPYFGQVSWFTKYHPEKVPSAIKRYQDETVRVLGVLDGVLASSPSGWLVGDKYTVADLSFLVWNRSALNSILPSIEGGGIDAEQRFPALYAWHQRVRELESVKKTAEIFEKTRKQTV